MAEYNNDIAGGKWRGMMTQKHIGYTSWIDNFPHEMLPKTERIVAHSAALFVAHAKKTSRTNGYIALDAENFVAAKNADSGAEWTIIEGLGRNKS
ncbi:glycosyhydrolase, partial [Parabacteroides distasonis]